jgi:hypothetical protein
MKKHLFAGLVVVVSALLPGCSGCTPEVGAVKSASVAGRVLKGPVSDATVTAYSVDEKGRRDKDLATAKTDADGAFVVDIAGHSGPLLVCAQGGLYTEESTGSLVQVGPGELCRLIDNVELGDKVEGLLINPWTSLHAELSSCFVEVGREASLSGASQRASLRLNDFLSAGLAGYDFKTTVPADVTTATGLSLSPEAWAGILAAGLSESATGISQDNEVAPGVRFTGMTLSAALRDDIAGGCVFDGVGAGGASLSEGVVALTADTLRGAPHGLAQSIGAFLRGTRNTSGIADADVEDLVRRLGEHRSEIFSEDGATADFDKPVVSFVAPAPDSTHGGVVRVEVTAVDASNIETFTFSAPAQPTFVAATPTCATDATGTSCTLVGSLNTSLEPVQDGPVTVTVSATDAAGNTQTAELTFTANNSLPAILVSSPSPDAVVDGLQTISATATDADGIQSLTVDIPGVGLCSSEPGAALVDIEPATGVLSCAWDTTRSAEGTLALTFHAVDGAGQAAELSYPLTVDNNGLTILNGFVDVGSPVVGATVTAVDWAGRVRGAVLGSATTDQAGAFSVTLDDADHAAVLLIVTDGQFVDLATGGTFPLSAGQELTSAVAALTAGDVRAVNVNAWTTFATSRARHTPSTTDDALAIATNINLLSQHVRRTPLGAPFSVATTKSADLTSEVVTIADQRTVLALSHAGLSRMAAEMSVEAGVAVGTITLVELVRVLALDLQSDPLFDGLGEGSVVTVGPQSVALSSLTTRFDLAASLDRFLAEAPLLDRSGQPVPGVDVDRNNSLLTRTDALNGRLYEALAEDNRGDLYADEGLPFDVVPPTIDLTFGGTNQTAVDGDSLTGTVQVNGIADDDSGAIFSFGATLLSDGPLLPDDDGAADRLRVFIGTDVLPNGAAAAEACAEAPNAAAVAALTASVCVCALAKDEQANIAERILCFTRPTPAPQVTAPVVGAIFTAGQQVQLSGSATGGFNLATCTASLSASPAQTVPSLPVTTMDGTSCQFTTTLPVTSLPDATWTFTMNATDIVGRAGTPATRSFVVDDTAPTMSAITLTGVTKTVTTVGTSKFIAADDPTAPVPKISTYTTSATATDNFGVSRVVFRMDGPNLNGPNIADMLVCVEGVTGACSGPSAVLVAGQPSECSSANSCVIGGTRSVNRYTATFADNRDDGARTISADVFDINGNRQVGIGSVVLNKDSVAPVFTWKPATQQNTWHDMAPTAGVQLCRSVDSGTDFRSSCESRPVTTPVSIATRDGAFFVGPTPTTPTNTMHVWRNFIRATLPTVGVVLPTVTAATVGDGTNSVRFGAGTTCPAASAMTKAKGLTNGGFSLNLALEDLGFDLVPINAARVCIRAVPVDAAGNEGLPADIFVKWDTVDPPLNVLVNPPNDTDPLAALAFASAAADPRTFLTGSKQVSMFHAFISNPYAFSEKVKLTPTTALVVDVTDTLSQRTARSRDPATRWPGNTTIQLQSPGSNIGRGPGNMTWNTTGLAATDDDPGNQLFVKVTTDSASTPAATKVSDSAFSTGVVTRKNNIERLDKTMVIDTFRFFSVDSAGVVGAELSPDAAGFISVPAATQSSSGLGFTRTASVVLAVAVGKMATGTQYRIAAPGESIPVMLRGTAPTGVDPDITTSRFVVTKHPVFDVLSSVVNVEQSSGFYMHAINGDGSSGSPLLCGSSAARALCRFYKRWFELEELRLVWNVGDGTTLKKIFTLSTKDPQNTVYPFSDASALVPMHPAWTGFEGEQQVLRTSVAPP